MRHATVHESARPAPPRRPAETELNPSIRTVLFILCKKCMQIIILLRCLDKIRKADHFVERDHTRGLSLAGYLQSSSVQETGRLESCHRHHAPREPSRYLGPQRQPELTTKELRSA